LTKSLGGDEIASHAIIAIANCIANLLDINDLNITISFSPKVIAENHGSRTRSGWAMGFKFNKKTGKYAKNIIRLYPNGMKKSSTCEKKFANEIIKTLLHELKHIEDMNWDYTMPEMYANAMEHEMLDSFAKIYDWYVDYNGGETND